MLDIVRNLVSSIFGKILLAIMVLSFALWGVGDILSSGNSQLAAKVGNEKISLNQFYSEFQETVARYNETTSANLSLKEAYERQLHNILLNDLIFSKMVNDYAKNNNILLNDESLKTVVTDLPQFKNENGNFSRTKYKNFIFNNFEKEELFLKKIEDTIYQGLIFENLNLGNFLNESIVDIFYNYEGEKRTMSYFTLSKDDILIDTSDKLLNDYFQTNKNKYATDEQIIVDYIEIKLENFLKIENITDEQIRNYYLSNLDLYTVKENRDIEFARFSSRENALNFYKKLNENDESSLEKFVAENSIQINKLSGFSGGTFPNDIIEELNKLKQGDVSKPLEYKDVGYYIFKILNINDKKVRQFEEVKVDIANYLASEEAFIEFDNTVNEADNMLLNDFNFLSISSNLSNINVNQSVNFSDLLSKFDKNINFENLEPPIGYLSDIIIMENVAYIYNVKKRIDSFIPSLNEIKDKVTIDYINSQTINELNSIINDIITKLQFKNYSSFQTYAKNNNLEIITIDGLKRTNSDFTQETVNSIFKINKGNILKVILSDKNMGIGFIKEVTPPDNLISNNFYNLIKNNVENNFNLSLENVIGEEIIKNTDYEIYSQNIDRLFM